jgi:hypothetical protein
LTYLDIICKVYFLTFTPHFFSALNSWRSCFYPPPGNEKPVQLGWGALDTIASTRQCTWMYILYLGFFLNERPLGNKHIVCKLITKLVKIYFKNVLIDDNVDWRTVICWWNDKINALPGITIKRLGIIFAIFLNWYIRYYSYIYTCISKLTVSSPLNIPCL